MRGATSGEGFAAMAEELRLVGFTLVDLIVVVAIMGLLYGVSALAFTTLRAPGGSAWARELRRARTEAIRTGAPVRACLPQSPSGGRDCLRGPLFLPDSRAIGPAADPLTGAPLDAPP